MAKVKNHTIQEMGVDELVDAPYNPRVISDTAREGLKRSLERFGNVQPIVWNKRTGHVVSGHQRLSILKEKGEKKTKVVVVDLSQRDEKALNITQNNQAITGRFDSDLQPLLKELQKSFDEDYKALKLDTLEKVEPKQSEREATYVVTVTCNSEEKQQELYEELKGRGFKCRSVAY